MFEFGLMYVDGNISPAKDLEYTGVIEIQMSHDNGLDVLDRVPGIGNGCGEFSDDWKEERLVYLSGFEIRKRRRERAIGSILVFGVVHYSKNIID